MEKTLPVSLVRPQLTKLVAELSKGGEPIKITHRGRVQGVLMSAEDYENLMETLSVLSDKEAMKAIKESEEDIKRGRLHTHEEIFGAKK